MTRVEQLENALKWYAEHAEALASDKAKDANYLEAVIHYADS